MIKNILLVFFSFSAYLSFSQHIEGKVLDAITKKPIEDVSVYIRKANSGTITNDKGYFYLKIPPKSSTNDTIYFSHISYKELKTSYKDKKSDYSVYLQSANNVLKQINLSEKRNLKPTIQFKKLASMKNAIHSFGERLVNDKIYVLGGDASFEYNEFKKLMEFDPENALAKFITKGGNHNWESYKRDLLIYNLKLNSWSTLSEPKFSKRAYHNLINLNNKLYVLGGKRLSKSKKLEYLDDKIEIFNLENNTITIDHTNPHQAVNFASFTYNNNIIVLGGSIKKNKLGVKEYTNKVHLYNTESGYWYLLNNMPVAKETQGVLINNKIYLIGGYNKKALNTIETYDLLTGTWKKEGELFNAISKLAVTSNGSTIYFFDEGNIYTYNIITKELKKYLIDLSLKSAKLCFNNNTLYILGGFKETKYSIFPSSGLFSIDISEFNNTKVNKSKKL
ncbi:kelch repeat-containing protein [Lutibacter sp. TH_r2]|uniref:Kelch repeat-containing protein n=1 Tax=Lutibacter sp. TH_r2 TaxID=3082083 RepID=UPI00295537ED|nr:kelch repeat-containing protein [Lutibacter sp. TH_r2]MDV7186617.1 kelch repeat-containing protein [Lutibacter sp. TH_r2]